MPYLLLALLGVACALLIAWIPLRAARQAWMPVAALVVLVAAGVVAALTERTCTVVTTSGDAASDPADGMRKRMSDLQQERARGVFNATRQGTMLTLQAVDPSVAKDALLSTVQSLGPTTDATAVLQSLSKHARAADPGVGARIPIAATLL